MSKCPNAQMPKYQQVTNLYYSNLKEENWNFCPNFLTKFPAGHEKVPKKNRTIFVWAENSVNAKMTHTKIGLFFCAFKTSIFMWANGHFSIVLDSSTNYLCPNAQTPKCPQANMPICQNLCGQMGISALF